ncbi:MAG: hypothetical protein K6A65_07510 [Succinivibrionaceae bacterium]|nr:hypothetical protein [Succinivibrionaceae bacterium]
MSYLLSRPLLMQASLLVLALYLAISGDLTFRHLLREEVAAQLDLYGNSASWLCEGLSGLLSDLDSFLGPLSFLVPTDAPRVFLLRLLGLPCAHPLLLSLLFVGALASGRLWVRCRAYREQGLLAADRLLTRVGAALWVAAILLCAQSSFTASTALLLTEAPLTLCCGALYALHDGMGPR